MNKGTLLFKKWTPMQLRIFLRKLRWKSTAIVQSLNSGDSVEKYCPVEEKKYRNFAKIGPHLISPKWGARQRHRFIWHYIQNHTDMLESEAPLLHISPEYSYYQKFIHHQRKNYFPVDKFMPGYDYLGKTEDFDLLEIKEEDYGKYQFIICNHVLEHIEDDEKAISNLYKLLNENGLAIISVPILPDHQPTKEDPNIKTAEQRKEAYGQWDHVRHYGVDIEERIKKAGFEVKMIDANHYFTEEEKEKYGVPRQDYLFELRK